MLFTWISVKEFSKNCIFPLFFSCIIEIDKLKNIEVQIGEEIHLKNKLTKGLGIGLGIGLSIYLTGLYLEYKEKAEQLKERETFGTGQDMS